MTPLLRLYAKSAGVAQTQDCPLSTPIKESRPHPHHNPFGCSRDSQPPPPKDLLYDILTEIGSGDGQIKPEWVAEPIINEEIPARR
ncbi:uncharacterized protein LAJ45_11545 [Morchella importuna]|uniref:uncharacterized protein n=1 Tax=Morchella importuna TaxID=1174673 RepID=UPI001E8E1882|nr:uncharacterized protein LAJ45_11545 [Morchella importuna]KAH8144480.1 hypothetical protein LAJ45_11545 [Morchella importuna]